MIQFVSQEMEISKSKAELDVVQGEKDKFETQSMQQER